MQTREKIKELYAQYLGRDYDHDKGETNMDMSDLAMLVRIVEQLTEDAERQDSHSHSIS